MLRDCFFLCVVICATWFVSSSIPLLSASVSLEMPRSAAGGHITAQGHDAPSQSAEVALAKLSASLKPQPVLRLPAFLSVRGLSLVLVVVLSLVLLLSLVAHSGQGVTDLPTVHAIARTGHISPGKIQWKSYTLPEAVEVSVFQARTNSLALMHCSENQYR